MSLQVAVTLYDGVSHEGSGHMSGPLARQIRLETLPQRVPGEACLRLQHQDTLVLLKIK